jgi:hypothetical protein
MKLPLQVSCAALAIAAIGLAAGSYGCGDPATSPDVKVDPTFTSIKANIFTKNCTTSSCHGTLGQRAGLVLEGTDDVVYASLVNAAAANPVAETKGLVRVLPGKPDSSFLMIKLTGPGEGEGERMPYQNSSLNQGAIDAVRTWIANGAKKD